MLILRSHFVNPFDLNWKCKHMRRKKEKPSLCHRFCLPPRPAPPPTVNKMDFKGAMGRLALLFFGSQQKNKKTTTHFFAIQGQMGTKSS